MIVKREGRFVVVELEGPYRVLSTSAVNGGQAEGLSYLLNHQSCEGGGHRERNELLMSQEQYHVTACGEAGVDPALTASMGTAANMNYMATCESGGVTALVTAGVTGNATCAGDPASWRPPQSGTINTILVFSMGLTPGALARAVSVMTEAKSAALARLAVPSLYSQELATGTGTDQFCVAAPLGGAEVNSVSPHIPLGEAIGVAVRDATLEALRWQNGLEPSYTRSLFHALGRYGVKEEALLAALQARLSEREFELLKKNDKAVFYEPMVAAAAFALAAVLDRVRYGTLPASGDAVREQATLMASALGCKPVTVSGKGSPLEAVSEAIAAGWRAKWSG